VFKIAHSKASSTIILRIALRCLESVFGISLTFHGAPEIWFAVLFPGIATR